MSYQNRFVLAVLFVWVSLAYNDLKTASGENKMSHPEIEHEGTLATYEGSKKYDKGHLLPFNIYSFDQNYGKSTFMFTNAVPQVKKFNQGEWRTNEGLITDYALNICCTEEPYGVLYLITGTTSWLHPWKGDRVNNTLKGKGVNPIRVPASIWTAGCCLKKEMMVVTGKGGKQEFRTVTTVVGNFAVIGDNLAESQTQQLSAEELQNVLKQDAGTTTVSLFPGNLDCSNKEKSIDLKDPIKDYEPKIRKKIKPNIRIGYKNFRDARIIKQY